MRRDDCERWGWNRIGWWWDVYINKKATKTQPTWRHISEYATLKPIHFTLVRKKYERANSGILSSSITHSCEKTRVVVRTSCWHMMWCWRIGLEELTVTSCGLAYDALYADVGYGCGSGFGFAVYPGNEISPRRVTSLGSLEKGGRVGEEGVM